MIISCKKSAILFRVTAGFAATSLRSYLKQTEDGQLFRLCTPSGRAHEIPVKSSHPYLGLIISYHDYCGESVRHRIQQGWATWTRLRPLLTKAGSTAPALDCQCGTHHAIRPSCLAPLNQTTWSSSGRLYQTLSCCGSLAIASQF